MDNKVALGSDHGGWALKEAVSNALTEAGYQAVDFSAATETPVDYPDIGHKVALEVSTGRIDRGILVCGTGIGMSLVANRYPGVRAALCHNIYTARMSREHNDANILVLGGRVIGEGLALAMLDCWLNTPFGEGRHRRRIDKVNPVK
ncbi:MAG: ribose 5-phosphate isomerase B [bacterium]